MAWFFDRFTYNRRLQLAHEEYVRPLTMGTDWNNIRIGVRFCINDSWRGTLSGVVNSCALYLGVRQGSTGPSFFDDNLVDWIGAGHIASTIPPTSGNGNYTAGTPGYYSLSNTSPNAVWKTGASATFATISSVTPNWVGSGAPGAYGGGFMSQLHVDIIKGSPYTFNTYYCTAAQVVVNVTDAAFMTALENQTTPTNMTQAVGKTIAYTGAGLFDTLSIVSWRTWPPIEIDMIGVARFA